MAIDAILIAGPTAGGKSALALDLAERIGGTVVNADSMQVYRELRVLTARPEAADEARAPHRLYGRVPATERYSAGRYADDVAAVLRETRGTPIIVGGTGLYFHVLLNGLSPIPAVPESLRNALRVRLEDQGADEFFAAFAAADPETAATLSPSDTQRVLRAASVLEATGTSLKEWHRRQGEPVLKDLSLLRVVLSPPKDVLQTRIAARVARMAEEGAVEEAAGLAGLDTTLPAARALGVSQFLKYRAGAIGLEEAVEAVMIETRQYAKRQLTWLRKGMKDWKWLETSDSRSFMSNLD